MITGISPTLSLRPSVGGAPTPQATGPISGVGPVTGAAPAAEPATDFASVLSQMALDAVQTVKSAEATSAAGVKGQATVQQVAEAVMAAEQTLTASISIRDKVVAAYLEISRMSI